MKSFKALALLLTMSLVVIVGNGLANDAETQFEPPGIEVINIDFEVQSIQLPPLITVEELEDSGLEFIAIEFNADVSGEVRDVGLYEPLRLEWLLYEHLDHDQRYSYAYTRPDFDNSHRHTFHMLC